MNGAAIAVSETFRTSKNRSFVVDNAGRILQKTENGGTQHYFYANDKPVGSSGALAAADFDYNYTPVTDQYPALTPGNYVVSAGDTLRGIALAVYGDAQLWYLIADANGLQTDAELTVGRNLTIPNKVTNLRNAYDTYKPYEPGKIIGDLTPTLPNPPPPKKDGGGCGGLGRIIVAIVAVVVTVLTAGALAPVCTGTIGGLWGAGVAALGSNIGIALVAGAVGSIASQAVGMALGVQSSFSWSNVALSAIGAGVSAGLGAAGVTSGLNSTLGEFGGAIAGAALKSVITQGIGVAVGLQDKFNWNGVAASAVGAGVSHVVGNAIGESQYGEERWAQIRNIPGELGKDFGNNFSRELVTGLAGGVAKQVVYGGKANWASVIGDAFGNALGNSLAYAATASSNGAQQVEQLSQAQGAANGWSAEQQALLDHAIAQGGMSEEDYWNNPQTQAGRYDEHFGEGSRNALYGDDDAGEFVEVGGRRTRDSLQVRRPNGTSEEDQVALQAVNERIKQLEKNIGDINGLLWAQDVQRRREEFAFMRPAPADTEQSAAAAQTATDQYSYPIDPTDGMRAEPSYAARSWGVLQDYGAGLFGTLYDTAKTAATGWKHIVTQPVETIKAMAWGTTSLAGMSINGYKQIWANPADAFGALKWGGGEALGWLNDQFSGPEAGKFVGQVVGGLLPLGSIKGTGRAGWSAEIESTAGANRGITTWNEFQGATKGQFVSRAETAAAWKVYQESRDASKTLVIGRLPDTEAAELAGFQRLNLPKGWTPAVNEAWIQGAIDTGRSIKLVSPVSRSTLISPPGSRFPDTIFRHELHQLKAAGYTIRNGWAHPSGF